MMGRTHLSLAILILSIYVLLAGFSLNLLFPMFLFVFSTLLPDIDHSKSLIGRPFKAIGLKLKHRGIMHHFMVGCIAAFALFLIKISWGAAFGAGFLLHILMDAITKEGIPVFGDLKIKGFVQTGAIFDNILFFGSIVATVVCIAISVLS